MIMNELIYSSAVLTMSQTTEFIRHKSVDITIINLIVQKRIFEFSIEEAYNSIHDELPVRKEQIEKSIIRSVESGIIETIKGSIDNISNARFKIPDTLLEKIDKQYIELETFLDESINELFEGLINDKNRQDYKELLIDVLTKLMAKYGYAYAGQLAGIGDATEFVPRKELKRICKDSIEHYKLEISLDELVSSIEILFDRRDPALNNLAFSICNRYYISRLMGLDLPIDFLAKNLYENAVIYLDTNIIMTIVYAKSKRHNEFREILQKAESIGITFAVSEITLAELHNKVQNYTEELDKASEIIPDDLLTEVQGEIVEKGGNNSTANHVNFNESIHKKRLEEMGVIYSPMLKNSDLFENEEYDALEEQISEFDRRYRRLYPAKNKNALFHDTYMYFLIRKLRNDKGNTSAWFLTLDNSMIEHGIATKIENAPPYSIRLFSLLQTLSQFVESQALKGEFADLFGELVSKDLLPRDQLFSIDDLKLLIGFDIRAKEIPPEFVRKATLHIKKNILKGGQVTEKNRAEAIHEFTKFLATPEQNFVEIRKKYDKKLRDRDEDLKQKEKEIGDYKKALNDKDDLINKLSYRVHQLEINQAKQKFAYDTEHYEERLNNYIVKELKYFFKNQNKLRIKYIIFLTISIFLFVAIYNIETILGWINIRFYLKGWIKFLISLLVFLLPFIKSFFEHKKVIEAFKMLNRKYKIKTENTLKDKIRNDYEAIHARPKIEDYYK